MGFVTPKIWESQHWNTAGIDLLEGSPAVLSDCWGYRLTKRWIGSHQSTSVAITDGKAFDLSANARLEWVHSASMAATGRAGLTERLILDKPWPERIQFRIECEPAVQFLHQPALTPETTIPGDHQPSEAVDSFAICASGRKIGHLYRPWVEDADGKQTWLGLSLIRESWGALVEVTDPSGVLATAKYPVIVDPNLGYSSIGVSTTDPANGWLMGCGPYDPGEDGSGTTVYCYTFAQINGEMTLGVYDDNAGVPNNLLRDTAGTAVTTGEGAHWESAALDAALAITNGSGYHIGVGVNNILRVYWDAGAQRFSYASAAGYSSGALSNPFPAHSNLSRQYSFYLEYTAGGGGFVPYPYPLHSLTGGLSE